eukprot:TRINITY_DN6863_c0_g1_i2.p1 TRINITY_DN6863_c0_g1~~TRINITY_DN6863_c0_g1_i2.p1  ORF type:complete len:729 (-),score=27.53 TRINITY_DN6863_c0_g1_i2:110-2296(-)
MAMEKSPELPNQVQANDNPQGFHQEEDDSQGRSHEQSADNPGDLTGLFAILPNNTNEVTPHARTVPELDLETAPTSPNLPDLSDQADVRAFSSRTVLSSRWFDNFEASCLFLPVILAGGSVLLSGIFWAPRTEIRVQRPGESDDCVLKPMVPGAFAFLAFINVSLCTLLLHRVNRVVFLDTLQRFDFLAIASAVLMRIVILWRAYYLVVYPSTEDEDVMFHLNSVTFGPILFRLPQVILAGTVDAAFVRKQIKLFFVALLALREAYWFVSIRRFGLNSGCLDDEIYILFRPFTDSEVYEALMLQEVVFMTKLFWGFAISRSDFAFFCPSVDLIQDSQRLSLELGFGGVHADGLQELQVTKLSSLETDAPQAACVSAEVETSVSQLPRASDLSPPQQLETVGVENSETSSIVTISRRSLFRVSQVSLKVSSVLSSGGQSVVQWIQDDLPNGRHMQRCSAIHLAALEALNSKTDIRIRRINCRVYDYDSGEMWLQTWLGRYLEEKGLLECAVGLAVLSYLILEILREYRPARTIVVPDTEGGTSVMIKDQHVGASVASGCVCLLAVFLIMHRFRPRVYAKVWKAFDHWAMMSGFCWSYCAYLWNSELLYSDYVAIRCQSFAYLVYFTIPCAFVISSLDAFTMSRRWKLGMYLLSIVWSLSAYYSHWAGFQEKFWSEYEHCFWWVWCDTGREIYTSGLLQIAVFQMKALVSTYFFGRELPLLRGDYEIIID